MAVALLVEYQSLFGLKTIVGRLITAPGVKPVPKQQWECKYFDVYGIVEPKTGEEFFWEFSHLDQECFGRFLGLVSQQSSQELNFIQLHRASAHTAKQLIVPDNMILLCQLPDTPELHPIERVWH